MDYGTYTDVFFAEGSGVAGTELLNFLGASNDSFTYVGFSLEAANGEVVSTDFLATQTTRQLDPPPPAVPVPAAVWLFGSGLLGMVGVARRKV